MAVDFTTNLLGKLAKFDEPGADEGKIMACWLDDQSEVWVKFHQPGGAMRTGIVDPQRPLYSNLSVLVEPFV